VFGALLERFLGVPRREPETEQSPEPVPAVSGRP
jgi:hypothetical protein